MIEFNYSLAITGASESDIRNAVHALSEAEIVPNILVPDTKILPNGSLFEISFSTDDSLPFRTTSSFWPDEDHEKFLSELSRKIPDLQFELTGENLDDPNNGVFKKAFRNGMLKEAYQEKQDIDMLLEQAEWRQYGSPEHENTPDVELNSTVLDEQGNAVQETLFSVKSNWLQNFLGVDNHTQLEALLTTSEEWDPTEILDAACKEPVLSGLSVGSVTALAPVERKKAILDLFKSISSMRSHDYYQIAADMAYMQENIELENPLSDGELYTLASKLNEAGGSWFSQPLLHEEYLDAIRYLLEYGIDNTNSPEFPELSADDARKLLLSADNQTFGTLVESVAIDNQGLYAVQANLNLQEIEHISHTIEVARSSKPSLSDKIAAAVGKSSHASVEKASSPER